MKLLTAPIAALAMMFATPIWAQTSPVVVELFTSQGCSSCPPADKLLHKLAKRDDVIALALHVDYWDYIGWKDAFASPANTRRQKGYARTGGRKMVYTPQMIVNGQQDVVGARAMEIEDLIAQHKAQRSPARVRAERKDGLILIALDAPDGPISGSFMVHLVRFTPERTVAITRGENAGKNLSYANVVDEWAVLSEWDGAEPLDLASVARDDRPAVVLVQQTGPGPIIAAAQID